MFQKNQIQKSLKVASDDDDPFKLANFKRKLVNFFLNSKHVIKSFPYQSMLLLFINLMNVCLEIFNIVTVSYGRLIFD